MKYVWIIIFAVMWIWWTVAMIKDVIYCCKHFKHPIQHVEGYTEMWITTHFFLTLIISFVLWLIDT